MYLKVRVSCERFILEAACAGNALGAEAYWLCAAHVYTPLPFRPGKGGFGDLFRTHFFLNAGNLGNINFSESCACKFPRVTWVGPCC